VLAASLQEWHHAPPPQPVLLRLEHPGEKPEGTQILPEKI
jgi:hypothetical protein